MKLAKRTYRPFPAFSGLWNDLFDDDFGFTPSGSMVPAVNIKEEDKAFMLELAVPGRDKEDFKIEVNKNVLTVSSEVKEEKEEQDDEGKYTRREFRFSSFSRSFTLPETVDGDNIEARYDHGLLYLSIPKREEAIAPGPRMIEIS